MSDKELLASTNKQDELIQENSNEKETVDESAPVSKEEKASPAKPHYESPLFIELKKEVESLKTNDEKIAKLFVFMKSSLDARKMSALKDFWDARRLCLSLFKEEVAAESRGNFWSQYKDLTQEAVQLKEILDEQNDFAAEQIDIAIGALEKEISAIEDLIKGDKGISKKNFPHALSESFEFYSHSQKTLNILNAFASRVNALRKELIKTEMRIKRKNAFFQRLSEIGDTVFPKRKEMIRKISVQFQEEVEDFVKTVSKEGQQQEPLFKTREAVKMMQGLAKSLTLNTTAFNSTRVSLSKVWDSIKEIEKVRRKDRFEKKEKMKEVLKDIEEKFEAFRKEYAEKNFGLDEASKKIDEITSSFKALDVGRDEWRWFKGEVNKLRKPIFEKLDQEEKEKKERAKQEEQKRQEKITTFKESVEALLGKIPTEELTTIVQEKEELSKELKKLKATKHEKQSLERLFRRIKDKITEKKEAEILSLPAKDKDALNQLKEILDEKVRRKKEVKKHLEELRVASGGSGLDFERAMEFDEQMQSEKETLAELDKSIEEINKKIKEFKTQVS
ncbi:MAG: hypothetical protein GWP59_01320 [Chlamydiales bacterium]|nr:hypothetical protein [Chlamydiales bacterium]NCF70318.1 hypothetical protein [Chlamydiales bacterium]